MWQIPIKYVQFLVVIILTYTNTSQAQLNINTIDSFNQLPYHIRTATSQGNIQRYLTIANVAQNIKYKKGEADAHANLALIYFYKGGRNEESLHHLFTAINIYDELKLQAQTANLYAMYGYGIRNTNIDKASDFLQKAIHIAEQEKDTFSLLGMYDNYGVILQQKGAIDSAYFYYNKALKLKREQHDTIGIPYSLNKLALLYLHLKQFNQSKEKLDEAYLLRKQLNDTIGLAENLRFYGLYYSATNQNNIALDYFKKALETAKRTGYIDLVKQLHLDIYKKYEEAQQYNQALHYYKQYTYYNDSINQINLQEKRAALEIEFESEVKEKQILLQRAELAESKLQLQRKNIYLLLIIGLLILTASVGWLVYKLQKQKNQRLIEENKLKDALAEVAMQQQLQEQRLKISRDLHDNIGAQLTFIISSIDNLSYVIHNTHPNIQEKLKSISEFTQGTIMELRDTIWAMNLNDITVEDLRLRINNLINKAGAMIENTSFNFKINPSAASITLSAFQGMNIYRTLQEAVNNAIKHANATEITIQIEHATLPNKKLEFTIQDNGIGFDLNTATWSNGLVNMKKRIQEINGDIHIASKHNHGTSIHFTI